MKQVFKKGDKVRIKLDSYSIQPKRKYLGRIAIIVKEYPSKWGDYCYVLSIDNPHVYRASELEPAYNLLQIIKTRYLKNDKKEAI